MPATAPHIAPVATKPVEAGVVSLTLPGPPRTKKNHGKIWMVGKRKIVKPSDAWIEWRDAVWVWWKGQSAQLGVDVLNAIGGRDLNCCALFYRDANRGDATGYYQGLADALEDVGIVSDDKHLTQWDGSRLLVDKANPRVEVTLTPVEGV